MQYSKIPFSFREKTLILYGVGGVMSGASFDNELCNIDFPSLTQVRFVAKNVDGQQQVSLRRVWQSNI